MVSPMYAALIVAAGNGSRAGADSPKQYVELGGKAILRHTLDCFLAIANIGRITVVIAEADFDRYSAATGDLQDQRLTTPVIGGATRALSVRAGLEALAADPPDQVLIHDAARPFAPPAAIRGVMDVLKIHQGAFLAVPVVDALWRTDGGFAIRPQDRSALWRAQTPQGFQFQNILDAHRSHKGEAADDVQIARAAGMLVQIVEGSEENFKITTPADIVRAQAHLAFLESTKKP